MVKAQGVSMSKVAKNSKRAAKAAPTQEELAMLKEENALLKQELAMLTDKKKVKKHRRSVWQSIFAGLCATVAVTSFVLFNLSFWVQQTVVDNDKFTAAVSPIIKDADVQKALQTEITTQIFTRVDVEAELQKVLPENLQFIAGPLASQFESFATAKIGEALNSPQVQQAWETTLSTTHAKLIEYIKNPQNDGKITVDEIYKTVGDQLSTSQVGFLFGKNLPSSIGSVTVKEVTWLPKARQYLNALDKLTKELAIATVAFTIAAIAFSRRRGSMVVGLISFSLLFMLITLLVVRIGYAQMDGFVKAGDYEDAARAVYSIISSSLVTQTQGFIALLVSFLLIILVVSQVDWMVWIRKTLRKSFDWISSKLPWRFTSPSWFAWLAHNKVVIAWTLTGVLFVSFALRIPPTKNGVITALVTSFAAVILLEVVASLDRVCGRKK